MEIRVCKYQTPVAVRRCVQYDCGREIACQTRIYKSLRVSFPLFRVLHLQKLGSKCWIRVRVFCNRKTELFTKFFQMGEGWQ